MAYTPVGTLLRLGNIQEASDAIFKAFRDNGFTSAGAAKALGVKKSTVDAWLFRHPKIRERIRARQIELARAELEPGVDNFTTKQ